MDEFTNILKLPTEIVVVILSHLGFQDLQNVALVNRFFYSCCKEKSLMSDIVVCIKMDEVRTVVQSPRFDNLRILSLSNQCFSEYTECFGKLVRRVEELEVTNCRISRSFLGEIFSEILNQTGISMKKLNLRNTRIRVNLVNKHNEVHYGEAIGKLEEVNFWGSSVLDFKQMRMFQEIGSASNLKILNLGCTDSLQWVESNAFGQVLNKLEVLNIRNSTISKVQFKCLLDEMELGTSLRVLKIGDNRIPVIGDICTNQLAVAMNNVQELELWPSEFTFEQMLALLNRIGHKDSKLKKVFLDEDTDRYMSASYPEVYPQLRSRFSQVVSFVLLPY